MTVTTHARQVAERLETPTAGRLGAHLLLSRGSSALAVLQGELHAVATRAGAPLTARPAWALASTEDDRTTRPWALVACAADGAALGAVLLVDRELGRRTTSTTLAGADGGHRGALLTRDPMIAQALGEALTHVHAAMSAPSSIVLGPLPAGCPLTDAFAAGLTGSWQEPADAVPVIRRGSRDGDPPEQPSRSDHLAAGMQRSLRKAANRLAADGRTTQVMVTRDTAAVLAEVPRLVEVHRQRDHTNGRVSELDDLLRQRIWLQRVDLLATAGVLELSTLTIDGCLAAYTLGVRDGSAYRLLEGRFVGDWGRYSPGRLLEAAVVDRALATDGITTFDWMTGVAPESLLGCNDADPMITLHLGRR